jgi:hypothetical protein
MQLVCQRAGADPLASRTGTEHLPTEMKFKSEHGPVTGKNLRPISSFMHTPPAHMFISIP